MGIELIYQIQSFNPAWFQGFMILCNWLDRFEFYMGLNLVIWWFYGLRAGLHLFYMLFTGPVVNSFLKHLFASPRPLQVDPSVGLVELQGFGFPSNGAEMSVVLAGLFFLYAGRVFSLSRKARGMIAVCYIALVSFSRMYIGAHFLMDVVGGWVVGLVLLGCYRRWAFAIEAWAKKLSSKEVFWGSVAAVAVSLLFPFPASVAKMVAIAAGVNFMVLVKKGALSR